MRVLLAGATGAIGRPLIGCLKQQGHTVFGLARSPQSAGILAEMGAEAMVGDALDPALVRTAIARVRPDAVINELTSLPAHYTPAEMKAAADRDGTVRREGNINLLAGMRESGVRRYVLQASGFWYAPGPGLADESSLLAVDASPGVAASARAYVELEAAAFRAAGIDCVAMRYGFFYGPGPGTPAPVIWAIRCGYGNCRLSVRARAWPVSSISMTPHSLPPRHSNVLPAPTTSLMTIRTGSAFGCPPSHALAGPRNPLNSPRPKPWRRLAPTASIVRRACAVPPTAGPGTTQFPPASARMAPELDRPARSVRWRKSHRDSPATAVFTPTNSFAART